MIHMNAVSYSTILKFNAGNTEITLFPSDELIRGETKTHTHYHLYYEIHFILSGSCVFNTENESFETSENSVIIIPPNQIHGVIDNEHTERFCLTFIFREDKKSTQDNTYHNLFSRIQNTKNITVFNKSYHNYIPTLIEYPEYKDVYHSSALKHLFALLLLDIANSLPPTPKSAEYKTEQIGDDAYRAMIIERYIGVHFQNPNASLSELANLMYLSNKQTARTVKKITGFNFKELLLKQRMHLAKELVEAGNMKMYEIAYEVGYNSYEIFYKAFSKYFDCAPTKIS